MLEKREEQQMLRDGQQSENTYILDVANAAEMVRLMHQSDLVTRGMGGLFPRDLEITPAARILDVACGSGGWVLDVAFTYPKVKVVGIDISGAMIEHARTRAWASGLENAHFQDMDALKPLGFPMRSFDLVNARFLGAVLPKAMWSPFVGECLRVLRPGGVVCLTEAELPLTNGIACERFSTLCARAMHLAGYGFSPDGEHLGVAPTLGPFLRQAGFQRIQHSSHVLEYSVGADEHGSMLSNLKVLLETIRPFLLKMEVISQGEFEILQHQVVMEMLADEFCACWWYLTIWGSKP